MNFSEAIEYLRNLTKFGFNFGLGRVQELLRRTDNPHEKLKVIHVGGTNGKGSTAAMLSSILQTAGYKVGFFTSPHLHSYTERYRINGGEIKEDRIADLITRMRPLLEDMVNQGFEHPTEFEVSTAMAFLYFWEEQVDLVVLEVGLGGAIDSTNVVTPLVSVITNVAMDHMDYLGNTITEIATVKAGIIKDNSFAVTASDKAEVLDVIRDRCRDTNSRLVVVGTDVTWEIKTSDMFGQTFNIKGLKDTYPDLKIYLLGHHQVRNAATALATVEVLIEQGYRISIGEIREGFSLTKWPARLEIVRDQPLVLLDGAHNLDGAISLKNALQDIFKYKKLILVFGMLGDKEREKVVAELAPLADTIIVTKPNNPRAGDWQQIAREAGKYARAVAVIENIHTAVEKGMSIAGPHDLVCITGSLYMVAEARELFIKKG